MTHSVREEFNKLTYNMSDLNIHSSSSKSDDYYRLVDDSLLDVDDNNETGLNTKDLETEMKESLKTSVNDRKEIAKYKKENETYKKQIETYKKQNEAYKKLLQKMLKDMPLEKQKVHEEEISRILRQGNISQFYINCAFNFYNL